MYVLKLGSCVERKENIDYKKREDYTDQREYKNLIFSAERIADSYKKLQDPPPKDSEGLEENLNVY